MKVQYFSIFLVVILFSGCATTQNKTLMTHLQMRVGELERQLDVKEEQIKDLTYEIKDLSYDMERLKSLLSDKQVIAQGQAKKYAPRGKGDTRIIRVPVGVSQIQSALKNAGFYEGTVDNKLGARTKRAIRDFQKENGLKADGIVGQKTWKELKIYLE